MRACICADKSVLSKHGERLGSGSCHLHEVRQANDHENQHGDHEPETWISAIRPIPVGTTESWDALDVPLDLPAHRYSRQGHAEHDEWESHAGEDAASVSASVKGVRAEGRLEPLLNPAPR
jgi:hypothetical protein